MTHVAVIDVGKTNAKLALVDLETRSELGVVTRANTVLYRDPWPHFDIGAHWRFFLAALADFQREFGIDAISITTHGACIALLGKDGGLAAPILDYEHDGPDKVAEAYARVRPAFDETGSPHLAGGLNAGAQLFWQFHRDPQLRNRVSRIVTYPQYWAYRLTGVAATEVTSLGCHTDLWNPHARRFSSLARTLDVDSRLAPVRAAGDVLGPVLPDLAETTGLVQGTPVFCGIHDSNASLLPHLLSRDAPFSVVSTGTWVVAMAIGGQGTGLDPDLDTLINVNALGDPVPSARFMGGREFDIAVGDGHGEAEQSDIQAVLNNNTMLLPAVVANTGPFRGRVSSWVNEPAVGSPQRIVAASYYLALVTAHCLKLIGHKGQVIVEGPFARNPCYLEMLAQAAGSDVFATEGTTGTSEGAALLCGPSSPMDRPSAVRPVSSGNRSQNLTAYIERWQRMVAR